MGSYPDAKPEVRELELTLRPRPLRVFPVRTAAPALLCSFVAMAERFVAGAMLLGVLPILTIAGIVVLAKARRSPFVAHQRIGRGGEAFWVLKLRTMWGSQERKRGDCSVLVERLRPEFVADIKRPDDPRVTSGFAAFCRKYSIDELPQLWHVVQGRMSLVGPRPMTFQELSDHYGQAAAEILRLKPGLTGLWQIRGRSRLTYWQRRRLDLQLVRNWSLSLYLRILLATIPRVLTGKDAW